MNKLSFNSINPFIRFSRKVYCTVNTAYSAPVIAYDHRLFYCIEGSGYMTVDGNNYHMTPGCVLFVPSNTDYLYCPDLEEPMIFYIWNFDFTHNFSNSSIPIPPDYIENFNAENILEIIHFTDAPIFNSVVYLENASELKSYLTDINKEFNLRQNFSDLRCSALATEVFVLIYKAALLYPAKNSQKLIISEIIDYVNNNYTQNISNSDIGKFFKYNPNYINSLFTKHMGISLHQYVLNTRINQAIRMIMDTTLPFYEISNLLGFKDYSQFLKSFKKITNVTPKHFRKY